MTFKNIALAVAAVLIIGSIAYLESTKVRPAIVLNNGEIPIDIVIENSAKVIGEATSSSGVKPGAAPTPVPAGISNRIEAKQGKYERAKEISSPDGFANVASTFTLSSIVGKKVILLDFWTFSCINCQRTTPYLNAWYQKYKDAGLEIVGIHTPEFDFEKNHNSVLAAVSREDIQYPVVMDNDYSTWTAYKNRFWPRRYLIDIDGFIVFDQIGEGNYDEMERRIQSALVERATVLKTKQSIPSGLVTPDMGKDAVSGLGVSPETYFGSGRNGNLANGTRGVSGRQTLTEPSAIQANTLYLTGTWNLTSEYAENESAAKIIYKYQAKNVYFVASAGGGSSSGGSPSPSTTGIKVKILRDGKPLTVAEAGEDVVIENGESTATIKKERLYKLIHESSPGEHTLEIQIENPGLQAYTFTFG